jgi:hypothetical protein
MKRLALCMVRKHFPPWTGTAARRALVGLVVHEQSASRARHRSLVPWAQPEAVAHAALRRRLDELDELRQVLLDHRLALLDDDRLRADRVVDLGDVVDRPRNEARACTGLAL